MSNDISYVIKVADDFSANIKKFQVDINVATKAVEQASGTFTKLGLISSKTFKDAKGNITAVSQTFRDFHGNLNTTTQKFDTIGAKSKFFTKNLIDLGKAAGLYATVGGSLSFGKSVFNTRIEMDSLGASLAAILPKFDRTKSGTQLAAEEMDYLRGVTQKFGMSFKEALPSYMQFLASSKQDLKTTRKTFESFTSIARLYGLSAQRFGLVITALNQMQSKGVVSMEELRQQLGESLPGALDLFAESAGVSTAKFMKLVGEGRVGAGLLKKVAENIEQKFGKDVVAASRTLGAETERLGNSWYNFKNILSQDVSPVLTSTVTTLTSGIEGLSSAMHFLIINAKKLEPILSPLANIVRMTLGGVKDFGTASYITYEKAAAGAQIARGHLWGSKGWGSDDIEEGRRRMSVANDASSELRNQMLYKEFNRQKVEIDINHNNAPRGTTVETRSPSGKNVRVGNIVNYQMQEAY